MPDSDEEVQRDIEKVFGYEPCLWQIQAVCAILDGGDAITIAPTGSGKSLTYWMLLLYIKYGIMVVVTPLKLLGTQFVEMLGDNRISAVSITAANATNKLFENLAHGQYQVIIGTKKFTNNLINLVLDEAHVVKEWGSTFHSDYLRIGPI
ncbi:hypothetical protein PILCRDRAFT_5178 [Piloderma croceum F 1598]|uniref:DNA 3'-5' helicase n=1 Tax=Piloderma croceum (strain F 1598) TaxID=765440 RepID=A0A0C3G656_PILCF|nr:hypothetical protein PILCRDRAFT_5178 [Piloderma croceum F 1598]